MPSQKSSLVIHPGAILREEFLEPLSITQQALSRSTGIPASRITEIIKGSRRISIDTAIRLSKVFPISADFWMRLQVAYDLEKLKALKAQQVKAIPSLRAKKSRKPKATVSSL